MTRKMRFRKGHDAGDAAFSVKLMPNSAERMNAKVGRNALKYPAKHCLFAQLRGITSFRFNQPFCTDDHLVCFDLPNPSKAEAFGNLGLCSCVIV